MLEGSGVRRVQDRGSRDVDILISGIEQEDESNDSVSCSVVTPGSVEGRADGLQGEEHQHEGRRGDEEEATAKALSKVGGAQSPAQVPDLEDTVDEELDRLVGNTDGVEDAVEIVRDQAVSRPLREEGDGDDNPHASAVSGGGEEGLPADGVGNFAVAVDHGLDFLIFKLDKRIIVIAVCMVVGQGLQRLFIASLAHEPTRRLGAEPDQANLDDGGESLKSGGDTP